MDEHIRSTCPWYRWRQGNTLTEARNRAQGNQYHCFSTYNIAPRPVLGYNSTLICSSIRTYT
jgi:hypothetical protein